MPAVTEGVDVPPRDPRADPSALVARTTGRTLIRGCAWSYEDRPPDSPGTTSSNWMAREATSLPDVASLRPASNTEPRLRSHSAPWAVGVARTVEAPSFARLPWASRAGLLQSPLWTGAVPRHACSRSQRGTSTRRRLRPSSSFRPRLRWTVTSYGRVLLPRTSPSTALPSGSHLAKEDGTVGRVLSASRQRQMVKPADDR